MPETKERAKENKSRLVPTTLPRVEGKGRFPSLPHREPSALIGRDLRLQYGAWETEAANTQ